MVGVVLVLAGCGRLDAGDILHVGGLSGYHWVVLVAHAVSYPRIVLQYCLGVIRSCCDLIVVCRRQWPQNGTFSQQLSDFNAFCYFPANSTFGVKNLKSQSREI